MVEARCVVVFDGDPAKIYWNASEGKSPGSFTFFASLMRLLVSLLNTGSRLCRAIKAQACRFTVSQQIPLSHTESLIP